MRRGGQRPRQPVAFMGEQPLEFALVRRQHAGAADRLEQRPGLVLEAGQGIRIEDTGLGRLEHAQHAVAQHLSDAGARPEQHAVAPWIGQNLREFLIVGEGRHHDRAQLGSVDRQRILGTDHGDQPGAGTQRGARSHARGTRGGGAAAQHQSVAMGVLMAGPRAPGQQLPPQSRVIGEQPALAPDRIRGNADVRDHQLADMVAARQQQMAGLGAVKSHGEHGRSRGPEDRAAVAIDAGGNVDRHHRHAGASHRLNRLSCDAVQGAREPGAEQPIDHEPGAFDQLGIEGQHVVGPGIRRQGRVAAQALPRAEQGNPDRPAALLEKPGGHEAVAAVVAGSAEHERRPWREAGRDRSGDRRAGVFHELDARRRRQRSRRRPPRSSPRS